MLKKTLAISISSVVLFSSLSFEKANAFNTCQLAQKVKKLCQKAVNAIDQKAESDSLLLDFLENISTTDARNEKEKERIEKISFLYNCYKANSEEFYQGNSYSKITQIRRFFGDYIFNSLMRYIPSQFGSRYLDILNGVRDEIIPLYENWILNSSEFPECLKQKIEDKINNSSLNGQSEENITLENEALNKVNLEKMKKQNFSEIEGELRKIENEMDSVETPHKEKDEQMRYEASFSLLNMGSDYNVESGNVNIKLPDFKFMQRFVTSLVESGEIEEKDSFKKIKQIIFFIMAHEYGHSIDYCVKDYLKEEGHSEEFENLYENKRQDLFKLLKDSYVENNTCLWVPEERPEWWEDDVYGPWDRDLKKECACQEIAADRFALEIFASSHQNENIEDVEEGLVFSLASVSCASCNFYYPGKLLESLTGMYETMNCHPPTLIRFKIIEKIESFNKIFNFE